MASREIETTDDESRQVAAPRATEANRRAAAILNDAAGEAVARIESMAKSAALHAAAAKTLPYRCFPDAPKEAAGQFVEHGIAAALAKMKAAALRNPPEPG